ncbi:cytidylate kinase [Desulfosarcina alkanivorans]|jgi:cytidylate kinase|uniref:Cytidylate kinase n=1 Tax=Desulfosarcina alkanivorans TaxID=571177 RepID=A0A5K7YEW7_9BACT|nr:(d)CMP kinase [Desulfosarcina alkanivorans]BBO66560.1 cytidylate kinase [Desulfosarcina alkanivorans]
MATQRLLLITIDGPAGAGKTTVSRMLARKLGYRYLDTGALYRAVAWTARSADVRPDDDRGLGDVCALLHLRIEGSRLVAGGEDITDRIRTPEITMLASAVSARPVVRQALLDIQRDMGRDGGLVAEGRDMGTVVFPDADFKFFLDATVRQRAMRRYRQYGREKGQSLSRIEADIRRRDANDSSRDIAPLKAADDALTIDSTAMTARQVVDLMMAHMAGRPA